MTYDRRFQQYRAGGAYAILREHRSAGTGGQGCIACNIACLRWTSARGKPNNGAQSCYLYSCSANSSSFGCCRDFAAVYVMNTVNAALRSSLRGRRKYHMNATRHQKNTRGRALWKISGRNNLSESAPSTASENVRIRRRYTRKHRDSPDAEDVATIHRIRHGRAVGVSGGVAPCR